MAEQVKVRLQAQDLALEGKALSGIACVYDYRASAEHPPIPKGALVNYELPIPLLIAHDYTAKVGVVHKVWEAPDGVRFIATLDSPLPEVPKGVSIGATLVIVNGQVDKYYIEEISLTDHPAYPNTSVKIIAQNQNPMKNIKEKLETIKATALASRTEPASQPEPQPDKAKLRAQTEEEIMAMIADLDAAVRALAERLDAMEQRLTAVETKLNQIADSVADVADTAQAVTTEVEASLKKAIDDLQAQAAEKEGTLFEGLKAVNAALATMNDFVKSLNNNKK